MHQALRHQAVIQHGVRLIVKCSRTKPGEREVRDIEPNDIALIFRDPRPPAAQQTLTLYHASLPRF